MLVIYLIFAGISALINLAQVLNNGSFPVIGLFVEMISVAFHTTQVFTIGPMFAAKTLPAAPLTPIRCMYRCTDG